MTAPSRAGRAAGSTAIVSRFFTTWRRIATSLVPARGLYRAAKDKDVPFGCAGAPRAGASAAGAPLAGHGAPALRAACAPPAAR